MHKPIKKTETVEEFLARGGSITTKSPQNQTKILREKQVVSNEEIRAFYQTQEWKQVRNEVRKEMTPFCPVCGSEEELVVDHINPVRYFWEQRLDKKNLQILCNDCNLEKTSMIGWTLQFHLENKKRLQAHKIRKEVNIKNIKDREEGKRATSKMNHEQQVVFQNVWQSYIARCRTCTLIPVSKYEFRIFLESKFVADTWDYPKRLKRYIKENFRKIE